MFIRAISKCVVVALSLSVVVDGFEVSERQEQRNVHAHGIPKKLALKKRACSRKPATTVTMTKVSVTTTSNILTSQTSIGNKVSSTTTGTTSGSMASSSPVIAVAGGYQNAVYFVNWYGIFTRFGGAAVYIQKLTKDKGDLWTKFSATTASGSGYNACNLCICEFAE